MTVTDSGVQEPPCVEWRKYGKREERRSVALIMDTIDLTFIPRPVRDTLDHVGIKLHLAEWQALTIAERQELCDMPAIAPDDLIRFRERLAALVWQRCGHAVKVLRTEC